MKVGAATADRFAKSPPAEIGAVLVYGPDSGLVRERAKLLLKAIVDDVTDPFRVVELTAAALRDDRSRLADEADAMSLTGGRRVVGIKGATDTVGDIIGDVLPTHSGDSALIVVEAGELGPRSKLRKLFETARSLSSSKDSFAFQLGPGATPTNTALSFFFNVRLSAVLTSSSSRDCINS